MEPTTGRSCGKCSLCCKLLHVIELNKPANQWCGHCKPGKGGCTIYDTRPSICRTYFCGWMLSMNVSDDWYPLKSHMVLSLGVLGGVQMVTVTVDPPYEEVWHTQPYYRQLKNMALQGLQVEHPEQMHLVQVRVSNRVWLILPNRDVEITTGSYVVKLAAPGTWEVEQYQSEDLAASRVAALVKRVPNHTTGSPPGVDARSGVGSALTVGPASFPHTVDNSGQ